jgi:hypothetical protein
MISIFNETFWFARYSVGKRYNKEILISIHEKRNNEIREYFYGREKEFIEFNVSKSQDFNRVVSFLGVKADLKDFPHKNKT